MCLARVPARWRFPSSSTRVREFFSDIFSRITDYGTVSGLVEGTFSAVVSDGTSTLTITNGTFSVVGMPDA